MKLSIIMPVFNESASVLWAIERVMCAPLAVEKELIVVDDGSTDGTAELLKKNIPGIVTAFHEKNRGKGAAIRTGIARASGDIVVVQDADREYNPADLGLLLKPILEDRADVVFGSRFISSQEHRVLFFWHMIGNKFLTLLSNMFTNLNLTDMEVGYKMFRRSILERITLREDRFGFEPEVTAKVSKLRCRIYEVGISYSGRTYQEGKKIGWKDGFQALWVILKYNLFPGPLSPERN